MVGGDKEMIAECSIFVFEFGLTDIVNVAEHWP
jgi:hypothetical protein